MRNKLDVHAGLVWDTESGDLSTPGMIDWVLLFVRGCILFIFNIWQEDAHLVYMMR
jgi:hypothetical protein